MSRGSLEVVLIRLADREFAFPVERVREVVRAAALSPAPGNDDRLEGLLNLRGHVVPVLAFARRIGLETSLLHPDHSFVILGDDDRDPHIAHGRRSSELVAVRSEGRCELQTVVRTEGELPYGDGSGMLADIVRCGQRLIGLVDVDRILASFMGEVQS